MKNTFVIIGFLFVNIFIHSQSYSTSAKAINDIDLAQDLIDQEKYNEALELIRPHKTEILSKKNFKNSQVFSIFSLIIMCESLIYMNKNEFLKLSEFENNEADRIKLFMSGNKHLTNFFFDKKESSIEHFIIGSKEKFDAYSIAIVKLKELLIEIDKITLIGVENRNEIKESLTKKYFWYKSNIFNPFSIGNYTPSLVELKESKSNLESLLLELGGNTFMNKESKIKNKETIEGTIESLNKSIKLKEFQDGKYQNYIVKSGEKLTNNNAQKTFSYFNKKIGSKDLQSSVGMYFQQISFLKNIISEIESTDLKKKDTKGYNELNYYIQDKLYGAYLNLRDYENALKHLDLTMFFYEKQPAEKKMDILYISYYSAFASIYLLKKEYRKSLEYALIPINNNSKHSEIMYPTIAGIYFKMREYDKSITYHKKYISVLISQNNASNKNQMISARFSLGIACLAFNMLDESEENLILALSDIQSQKELTYWNYILSFIYEKLGIIYMKKKMFSKANDNMIKFSGSHRKPFFETMLNFTEETRATNNNEALSGINSLFYFISQNKDSSNELVSMGYDYAMLSKEMLLNTIETIRNNASINSIPQLKEINDKWGKVKEKLKDVDIKTKDSLQDLARVYEKELIVRGKKSILELFENSKVKWTDVKNQLRKGEAAVELVSYMPYEFEKNYDEVHYGAFVLKKESQFPVFISLFKQPELDEIVNPIILKNLSPKNQISEIYKSKGVEVYNLIWQPLEKYLFGVKRIYFSPSGILHNFSFSALPIESQGESLGEKYKLIQLSSTKNIVQIKTAENFKSATLFGDIAYNNDKKVRPVDQISSETRGSDFNELKGTIKEINEINNILRLNNIETIKYVRNDATEENLISSLKKEPSILHIGTHAFYLKPNSDEFFMTDMLGFARLKGDKDPMNRSGLALSGANYFWKYGDKIQDDNEDGILTANEIASLNMQKVDLVVLSACETALGESANNEGVFGLQRGLKMAGVKNLLVSLWKVDDKVTQEYMVEFYKNLIENKLGIQSAYHTTQNTIRGKYPNPYYWAAFVLIR